MSDSAITPRKAINWLETFNGPQPLGWRYTPLAGRMAAKAATDYAAFTSRAVVWDAPPAARLLQRAKRILTRVFEGCPSRVPVENELLQVSASVCRLVGEHPLLGAILVSPALRAAWPPERVRAGRSSFDADMLKGLLVYSALQGQPLAVCCNLAGVPLCLARVFAPLPALAVCAVMAWGDAGVIPPQASSDAVLALAAMRRLSGDNGVPGSEIAERALLVWMARNARELSAAAGREALLAYLSSFYRTGLDATFAPTDRPPALFADLFRWVRAGIDGEVREGESFTPQVTVEDAKTHCAAYNARTNRAPLISDALPAQERSQRAASKNTY